MEEVSDGAYCSQAACSLFDGLKAFQDMTSWVQLRSLSIAQIYE